MSGMKVALWPLSMKVVSANPASPSGSGSATGMSSTNVRARRPPAPPAVAGAVEAPAPEQRAVGLVQVGGIAGLVEELAGEHVNVPAGDARLDGGERALERLVDELVVGDELIGRLADDKGSRHVRVAGRRFVSRPEVEHDRLVRLDLARAHLVADRGLRAMRDDEL